MKSEAPKLTQKFKQEFTAVRVKSEANPESIKMESECDRMQKLSENIQRKLFQKEIEPKPSKKRVRQIIDSDSDD